MNSRRRRNSTVVIVFLFTIVGVVSPFAVGSAEAGSNLQSRHQRNLFQLHKPLSAVAPKSSPNEPRRSRIRSLLSNFKTASSLKNERWKAGESKATIPSRLLFTYVNPLLKLASERTLTEKDSFEVAENRKMKYSVDSLAGFYDKTRRKAQKRIEEQRQKGSDVVKNSQSAILLKALLKQQRGMLILTGVLRLINTGVQAFPAILVARLLRCVEAGDTIPLSKALWSAALLVSVLNLKMVTENQFFHNVVNMSTKTRGSLEGLIFDKSLRLPGGGSGVLARRSKGEEKKALGSGGVLNLMQTDASTIETTATQIHTIWDGPLQVRRNVEFTCFPVVWIPHPDSLL